MKKISYLLIFIFSLFFISDVKAAITDDMYFVNYAGFINGAYVYNKSQYINNQPFSITPNSGMAVTFDITFQSDKDLVGQNYILQVDICSEISNYAGGSSPYYFTGDFVFGGHLSHKVQDLGSCQINGYNAFLITDYYLFSILDLTVNSEEGGYVGNGKVGSSGGVYSPNYPISLEISNVSILDYDLSFINGLEQNNSQQETNDKLDDINDSINSDSDDVTSKSCGIVCKLKGIFTGITELPSKLVNLLIDGLKSLFVPSNEQLQEIIEDSSNLAENFGFVGQTIDFFINIFTSLLGMVNGDGCITLPEMTIGATTLFDEFTFWEEQQYCLSSNEILSSNIETIRTITSIALVSMFLCFAAAQFHNILSKTDNYRSSKDSYSIDADNRD